MFADASEDHETKRCQLRESKCTHGCGEMIPYHNIKNHWEEECIKRPIACVQCKNLIVAEEMALHMNVECPRRLYLCFVGCGKKVAVGRLKHERDECMLDLWHAHLAVGVSYTAIDVKITSKTIADEGLLIVLMDVMIL